MEDEIKVSELPQATQINDNDLFMIIQGQANKKATAKLLLDFTHPVGSLYWSANSTSPSTLFGGTWEAITDKFILAAGSSYTAGDTGGEATHTLTTDEMPSHNHKLGDFALKISAGFNTGQFALPGASGNGNCNYQQQDRESSYVANTGGGQPHNNMPPYLVAYCWKRTA